LFQPFRPGLAVARPAMRPASADHIVATVLSPWRTLGEWSGAVPSASQRWAIRRYYTVVDFAGYDTSVHAQRAEPRRRCSHCSRALPAGARSDARFCSESCRRTHFRHQAVYNAVTNARSAASLFRARPRADTCYCSSACRQLAYRERIRCDESLQDLEEEEAG